MVHLGQMESALSSKWVDQELGKGLGVSISDITLPTTFRDLQRYQPIRRHLSVPLTDVCRCLFLLCLCFRLRPFGTGPRACRRLLSFKRVYFQIQVKIRHDYIYSTRIV